MIEKFEKMDGELLTAGGHEIRSLTLQGWHLVFSYEETRNEPCSETEMLPAAQNNNGYNYGNGNGTVQVTKYKPVTTTWFVLRKGESERMAELSAEVQQARQELDNQLAQRKKEAEELKKAKDALTIAENNAKFEATRLKNIQDERDRFRSTQVKLEGDLAKVRKAIGERSFAEILPPPETTKPTATV